MCMLSEHLDMFVSVIVVDMVVTEDMFEILFVSVQFPIKSD